MRAREATIVSILPDIIDRRSLWLLLLLLCLLLLTRHILFRIRLIHDDVVALCAVLRAPVSSLSRICAHNVKTLGANKKCCMQWW